MTRSPGAEICGGDPAAALDLERVRRGDLEGLGLAARVLERDRQQRLVRRHEGLRDRAVGLLAGPVVARQHQVAGLQRLDGDHAAVGVDRRAGREADPRLVALAARALLGRLLRGLARVVGLLLGPLRGQESIDRLGDPLGVLGQLDGDADRLEGRERQRGHDAGHDVALGEAIHGVGDAEDVESELLELLSRIELLCRLRIAVVGLGCGRRVGWPRLAAAVPVVAGARHRPAERRDLLAGAVGPLAGRAAQRLGRDQAAERQPDREDDHLQRTGAAPVVQKSRFSER